MMKVFVLGPAGCGKSTFVKVFSEYLRGLGSEVGCVNLDPATEPIFDAEINIRNYVKTEEVMKKYKLGINGGLIKSVELSLKYVDKLAIEEDYVLYDTPGQMELFIYFPAGRKIVNVLSDSNTVALFLMDSSLIKDSESFLSAVMQNVIVSLRLSLPTATVLTKSDLADVDINRLQREIKEKDSSLAELLERTAFFMDYTTLSQRIVKISNTKRIGLSDVYSLLHEMFCTCGDVS